MTLLMQQGAAPTVGIALNDLSTAGGPFALPAKANAALPAAGALVALRRAPPPEAVRAVTHVAEDGRKVVLSLVDDAVTGTINGAPARMADLVEALGFTRFFNAVGALAKGGFGKVFGGAVGVIADLLVNAKGGPDATLDSPQVVKLTQAYMERMAAESPERLVLRKTEFVPGKPLYQLRDRQTDALYLEAGGGLGVRRHGDVPEPPRRAIPATPVVMAPVGPGSPPPHSIVPLAVNLADPFGTGTPGAPGMAALPGASSLIGQTFGPGRTPPISAVSQNPPFTEATTAPGSAAPVLPPVTLPPDRLAPLAKAHGALLDGFMTLGLDYDPARAFEQGQRLTRKEAEALGEAVKAYESALAADPLRANTAPALELAPAKAALKGFEAAQKPAGGAALSPASEEALKEIAKQYGTGAADEIARILRKYSQPGMGGEQGAREEIERRANETPGPNAYRSFLEKTAGRSALGTPTTGASGGAGGTTGSGRTAGGAQGSQESEPASTDDPMLAENAETLAAIAGAETGALIRWVKSEGEAIHAQPAEIQREILLALAARYDSLDPAEKADADAIARMILGGTAPRELSRPKPQARTISPNDPLSQAAPSALPALPAALDDPANHEHQDSQTAPEPGRPIELAGSSRPIVYGTPAPGTAAVRFAEGLLPFAQVTGVSGASEAETTAAQRELRAILFGNVSVPGLGPVLSGSVGVSSNSAPAARRLYDSANDLDVARDMAADLLNGASEPLADALTAGGHGLVFRDAKDRFMISRESTGERIGGVMGTPAQVARFRDWAALPEDSRPPITVFPSGAIRQDGVAGDTGSLGRVLSPRDMAASAAATAGLATFIGGAGLRNPTAIGVGATVREGFQFTLADIVNSAAFVLDPAADGGIRGARLNTRAASLGGALAENVDAFKVEPGNQVLELTRNPVWTVSDRLGNRQGRITTDSAEQADRFSAWLASGAQGARAPVWITPDGTIRLEGRTGDEARLGRLDGADRPVAILQGDFDVSTLLSIASAQFSTRNPVTDALEALTGFPSSVTASLRFTRGVGKSGTGGVPTESIGFQIPAGSALDPSIRDRIDASVGGLFAPRANSTAGRPPRESTRVDVTFSPIDRLVTDIAKLALDPLVDSLYAAADAAGVDGRGAVERATGWPGGRIPPSGYPKPSLETLRGTPDYLAKLFGGGRFAGNPIDPDQLIAPYSREILNGGVFQVLPDGEGGVTRQPFDWDRRTITEETEKRIWEGGIVLGKPGPNTAGLSVGKIGFGDDTANVRLSAGNLFGGGSQIGAAGLSIQEPKIVRENAHGAITLRLNGNGREVTLTDPARILLADASGAITDPAAFRNDANLGRGNVLVVGPQWAVDLPAQMAMPLLGAAPRWGRTAQEVTLEHLGLLAAESSSEDVRAAAERAIAVFQLKPAAHGSGFLAEQVGAIRDLIDAQARAQRGG